MTLGYGLNDVPKVDTSGLAGIFCRATKPQPRKRANEERASNILDGDEGVMLPPPPKATSKRGTARPEGTTKSKKVAKPKAAISTQVDDEDEIVVTPRRVNKKKRKSVGSNFASDDQASSPPRPVASDGDLLPKKKSAPKRKKPVEDTDSEDDDAPPKKKPAPKRKKRVDDTEDEGDGPPKKFAPKRKKRPEENGDEEDDVPPKKKSAPKRKSSKKDARDAEETSKAKEKKATAESLPAVAFGNPYQQDRQGTSSAPSAQNAQQGATPGPARTAQKQPRQSMPSSQQEKTSQGSVRDQARPPQKPSGQNLYANRSQKNSQRPIWDLSGAVAEQLMGTGKPSTMEARAQVQQNFAHAYHDLPAGVTSSPRMDEFNRAAAFQEAHRGREERGEESVGIGLPTDFFTGNTDGNNAVPSMSMQQAAAILTKGQRGARMSGKTPRPAGPTPAISAVPANDQAGVAQASRANDVGDDTHGNRALPPSMSMQQAAAILAKGQRGVRMGVQTPQPPGGIPAMSSVPGNDRDVPQASQASNTETDRIGEYAGLLDELSAKYSQGATPVNKTPSTGTMNVPPPSVPMNNRANTTRPSPALDPGTSQYLATLDDARQKVQNAATPSQGAPAPTAKPLVHNNLAMDEMMEPKRALDAIVRERALNGQSQGSHMRQPSGNELGNRQAMRQPSQSPMPNTPVIPGGQLPGSHMLQPSGSIPQSQQSMRQPSQSPMPNIPGKTGGQLPGSHMRQSSGNGIGFQQGIRQPSQSPTPNTPVFFGGGQLPGSHVRQPSGNSLGNHQSMQQPSQSPAMNTPVVTGSQLPGYQMPQPDANSPTNRQPSQTPAFGAPVAPMVPDMGSGQITRFDGTGELPVQLQQPPPSHGSGNAQRPSSQGSYFGGNSQMPSQVPIRHENPLYGLANPLQPQQHVIGNGPPAHRPSMARSLSNASSQGAMQQPPTRATGQPNDRMSMPPPSSPVRPSSRSSQGSAVQMRRDSVLSTMGHPHAANHPQLVGQYPMQQGRLSASPVMRTANGLPMPHGLPGQAMPMPHAPTLGTPAQGYYYPPQGLANGQYPATAFQGQAPAMPPQPQYAPMAHGSMPPHNSYAQSRQTTPQNIAPPQQQNHYAHNPANSISNTNGSMPPQNGYIQSRQTTPQNTAPPQQQSTPRFIPNNDPTQPQPPLTGGSPWRSRHPLGCDCTKCVDMRGGGAPPW